MRFYDILIPPAACACITCASRARIRNGAENRRNPAKRLLHKAAAGLSRRRLAAGFVSVRRSRFAGCWVAVLGECWGPGRAPEFEEVVGGGDQFPLGLAGS